MPKLTLVAGMASMLILASCGGSGLSNEESIAQHPTTRFLRAQQARNTATVEAVRKATEEGNPADAVKALERRQRELDAARHAIDEGVRSGQFHADDRSVMHGPLIEEQAWVSASLAALR